MSAPTDLADFTADTAVEPLAGEAGRYGARIEGGWSAPPGPNGGYIAALLVAAIGAEVGDRERMPRSITIHYMRPPALGEIEIAVTVERSGRSATTATARMSQQGKLTCLAVCVLAGPFDSAAQWSQPAPSVPPAEELDSLEPGSFPAPIFSQLDLRLCFGAPPFSSSGGALAGGWMRTRRPAPLGPELLALYADAWWPAPFARLAAPVLAPTLELTIHFRAIPPPSEHAFVLGRFVSGTSAEGYFEEDGQLWSRDGVLLVQSRQLALCRPWNPDGEA